jgi:hypothetical protein
VTHTEAGSANIIAQKGRCLLAETSGQRAFRGRVRGFARAAVAYGSGATAYVRPYFDGSPEALWLKRWRCPDCGAVHRYRPDSHWRRFLAPITTILAILLEIPGGKGELFADDAVTALHQSSGGILRKAGILARGAMLAAVQEHCPVVTAEHVRVATTETL